MASRIEALRKLLVPNESASCGQYFYPYELLALRDLLATLEKVRELRDRLVAFSNKNSRITCNEYEQDRAQQADNDAEELTEILAPWEGDKR